MLNCSEDDVTVRKSPKHEHEQRPCTPDFEQQQPCTSKQSHTPEKHKNDINTADSAAAAAAVALPSSSAVSKLSLNSSTSSSASQQPYSSFYQELLEASYANNGKRNKTVFYDNFSFLRI